MWSVWGPPGYININTELRCSRAGRCLYLSDRSITRRNISSLMEWKTGMFLSVGGPMLASRDISKDVNNIQPTNSGNLLTVLCSLSPLSSPLCLQRTVGDNPGWWSSTAQQYQWGPDNLMIIRNDRYLTQENHWTPLNHLLFDNK